MLLCFLFLQYKNYEHPTENDISNWELILKSAFNIVKRSGVNRIEFLRFVIDRTSLINTNANIGNVVILVVHNKLNMMYNEDDETAYLSKLKISEIIKKINFLFIVLPTYSNPKRLCNLRIDHLPLCVMFNSLRAEKFNVSSFSFQLCSFFSNKMLPYFQEFCQSLNIRRPWISVLVANRE